MDTSEWGVDSIHINVGHGDSAIHLLVTKKRKLDKKLTVVRATLIDGGSGPEKVIENAIERIKNRYIIARGQLQFDSVVITHWDKDHYRGVLDLINKEIKNEIQKIRQREKRGPTQAELNAMQPRWLKYKGNARTNPETTFYIPYWEGHAKNSFQTSSQPPAKKSNQKYNDRPKVLKEGTPGCLDFETYNEKVQEKPVPEVNGKGEKIGYCLENICKLVYTPDQMLGVNFLTNAPLKAGADDYTAIHSPKELLDPKNTDLIEPVGIFCIASFSAVMGDPDPLFHQFVVNEDNSPKNWASIGAIVLWKTGEVSHYFAGDAFFRAEESMQKWIGGHVTSMKLSHHGSSTSTPPKLLDTFKPKNILASCGWELLLYLNAWLFSYPGSRPVFSMLLPYYIEKSNKGMYECNGFSARVFSEELDPSDPDSKPVEDFLGNLKDLYSEYNKSTQVADVSRGILDIEEQFKGWMKKYNKRPPTTKDKNSPEELRWEYNNRAWVAYQVEHAWHDSLSLMYSPSPSGARPPGDVICIIIESRKVDDGMVTCIFRATEKKYKDNKPKSALAKRQAYEVNKSDFIRLFHNIPPEMLKSATKNYVGTKDTLVDAYNPAHLSIGWSALGAEGTYWIASSDVQLPDPNVHTLADGTPLNSFVHDLHGSIFGLASQPSKNSVIPFVASDEWLCWMDNAVWAVSLSAKFDSAASLTGYALKLTWPNDKAIQNAQYIKFGTDFVAAAFNILPDQEPPIGLLGNGETMVFGLDSTQSLVLRTTLLGALEYAGLEELAESPLVDALGGQFGLTLSSAPGSSNGARNAVWFEPGNASSTTVRLQWDIDDIDKVRDFFGFLKGGFSLGTVHLITRRTSTWRPSPPAASVVTVGEVILSAEFVLAGKRFLGAIELSEDKVVLELTTNDNVFEEIVEWLRSCEFETPFVEWLREAAQEFLSRFMIRRIMLQVEMVDGQRKITDFSVQIEIELGIAGGGSVLFTYSMESMRGEVWCVPAGYATPRLLFPSWEECRELFPITPAQEPYLDLARLFPGGVSNIPDGIPHEVTEAVLEIDSTSISFAGTIACVEPKENPHKIPTISLDRVSLDATYAFGGDSKGTFSLGLNVDVELRPPTDSEYQSPTKILGSVSYEGSTWTLRGSMDPCYGSTLYAFFDPDARGEVMTFLEALQIYSLNLEYQYQKGVGSFFKFAGSLHLGELALDLTYQYDPTGWSFDAILGATNRGGTVGSIVESITGEDDLLLPFVADIPVASTTEGGAVSVLCRKHTKNKGKVAGNSIETEAGKENEFLFFSASVQISPIKDLPLKATFMQYRDLGGLAAVMPKRIIKVSVCTLPPIEIPVVGNLTQPFDEMFYLWVQEKTLKPPMDRKLGLTEKEVQCINDALMKGDVRIDDVVYKDTRKQGKDSDVVIVAGSHFVLVVKEKGAQKVIIDYSFNDERKPKPKREEGQKQLAAPRPGGDSKDDGNSSLAPFKKSVGPISISNIGFKYKDGTLSVLMDAAFVLGPIGFTLIGFSVDLHLQGVNLQHLPAPSFSLSGLAVKFDQPPIRLAGLYAYVNNDDIKYFAGGIIVSFAPYMFMAAGFYGETKQPKPFTSVFVFGKLDGPLVTLEFAEISGITGGFGYNTEMRFPAVADVPSFPFVAGTGVGDDIMETLKNLVIPGGGGWFSPRDGSFWLAAGLKVAALESLSIDAVVVVSWNPYVKLGIFGVAMADIPRSSPRKFAHVELGISAVVDFEAGVMRFEAQLSPRSYIFEPNCHLTGGFALYYWFKGSSPALEGDWVFTIGGFHRAYSRPAHYPNPPRLGISWSVDKNVSITGEAYFAITPKCCMGGGRLKATLDIWILKAWFEAYADFLINYKPFHFTADGGVCVGISATIDLIFTSKTFELEIGANLHLEGPPLSGRVHIDCWIKSFDINFGPDPTQPGRVKLRDFYLLVLQAEKQASLAPTTDAPIEEEEERPLLEMETDEDVFENAHVFGCRSGLLEDQGRQETGENAPWQVRAGTFSFAVSCRFAINKASVVRLEDEVASVEGEKGEQEETPEVSCATPIYAKPMHLTRGLSSDMVISIQKIDSKAVSVVVDEDVDADGDEEEEEEEEEEEKGPHQWQIQSIIKAVPSALWGKYDPSEDPQRRGNNIGSLLKGNDPAIKLLMGATLLAPEPQCSPDKIPKFSAIEAMQMNVSEQGAEPVFLPFKDASTGWSPAAVEDKDAQWDAVRDVWAAPKEGVDGRREALELWQAAMGWTKPLDPRAPERLLRRFDNLYLAAPMISVG